MKKFNKTVYSVNPSELYDGEIFVDITEFVVPGIYDYYQISNYGRVFHKYLNKFLKLACDGSGNGYYFFVASTIYGTKTLSVHRTELMCFNPNPFQDRFQVNHIDGNPHNNHISNLEWVTRSENIKHSYSVGLHSMGEESTLSKINNETARQICELLSTGNYTNKEIANIVGNGATEIIVSDIKQGTSWNFISKDYQFHSRPGRLFTDLQINKICKYFEDNDIGSLTINEHCRNALAFYGYDNSERYIETVRKIYVKKHYTSISCNYNF